MNINDCIHQLRNGQWIVAQWDAKANQYHAPMTAAQKRATGCYVYFAKKLEGLSGYIYKNRSSAIKRARMLYEI